MKMKKNKQQHNSIKKPENKRKGINLVTISAERKPPMTLNLARQVLLNINQPAELMTREFIKCKSMLATRIRLPMF